jgi:hypothetical protein
MSDPNQFLRESRMGRFPNARFENVGDSVTGTIVGLPHVVESQFGPALVVDLANEAYPGGGYTVWVKQGMLGAAVADAVGDHGIAEGGRLQIVFTGTRDTGKPSPLKEYEATYEPPQAKVDLNSVFGSNG